MLDGICPIPSFMQRGVPSQMQTVSQFFWLIIDTCFATLAALLSILFRPPFSPFSPLFSLNIHDAKYQFFVWSKSNASVVLFSCVSGYRRETSSVIAFDRIAG